MHNICPRYAKDIHNIFPRYAQDKLNICLRYAQYIPKICPIYAKDILGIIHHSNYLYLDYFPVSRASSDDLDIPKKGWERHTENGDIKTESPVSGYMVKIIYLKNLSFFYFIVIQ